MRLSDDRGQRTGIRYGYQRADEEVFFGMLASASARPQHSDEAKGTDVPARRLRSQERYGFEKCILLQRQFHQLNQSGNPNSCLLLYTYLEEPA